MGVIRFDINGIAAFPFQCNKNWFSSYGTPIRWRPFFGLALNTRNARKIQVFHAQKLNYGPLTASSMSGSNAGLVNDGLLSKDLEFKPSFDEYLKAMESVRTAKSNTHDIRTKEQKIRKKGMSRKTRWEGDEGNKKVGMFGGHRDEENELQVSNEDGASKVIKIARGKEGSFTGNSKLRVRGTKKGNFNVTVSQKQREYIKKDKWSKHPTHSSEPESNDFRLIKTEGGKAGNSITRALQSHSHGSITEGEVITDFYPLKMLEEENIAGSQKNYKSVEKTRAGDKIVVSNNAMCRGLRRGRTKIDNVIDNNYDNLEVERAAFRTIEEFNDVMCKPQLSRKELEEKIRQLAKLLNGADINIPEWIFSKMMRSARIKYNDYSITRVIQILGNLGNWRRVIQVIEWLQRRERFKSHKLRHIYTAALDALGRARRPVEALNVFHAMQQQMSSYPDLVAYHSISITLGQAGQLKELFDVIDIMMSPPKKKFKTGVLGNWDPRLEPDIVVYNAVLNACVQQKQWQGAFWVLQQLKKQGQQPSATTYGLVMEVMFSCGKYNLVHELFRKVQKSSIPNSLTYRVLVNTLWKEGKIDEAVLAVQDMERRGIVGSASLYYDLARCLCAAGRCTEALMQIEKICTVANKPLVVTYTGLIKACLDSGNILDGASIFKKMKDVCSPNLVTCNIMLKAYLEHGMFQEAKELFEMMSENASHVRRYSDYRLRVIPDIYTFNTMLDACVAEKRWDYFDYVYPRMLQHGYHFNPKRHLRMILAASRAGKDGPLEATWKQLSHKDCVPPASLIKERFCAKLEKDDHVAALACIAHNPSKDLQAFSRLSWLNLFRENAQRFQKDTLVRLINELSIIVSEGSLPYPTLENLRQSCKEFCTTDLSVADMESGRNLSAEKLEPVVNSR